MATRRSRRPQRPRPELKPVEWDPKTKLEK